MDVPEGVDIRTVLQTLFENEAPNIPEAAAAAAAQPGDPGMLTTDALQPTFPPERAHQRHLDGAIDFYASISSVLH